MSARRMAVLLCLCCAVGGLSLSVCSAAALAAAAPAVEGQSVLDVASGSATFQAQVNPEGSETTYRFEYGTSTAYGASVPVPARSVGSGTSPVTVTAHTQSLLAHTLYHFRIVAVNVGGSGEGADQTFTTQTAGGELELLDGRQWELVSPQNKHGASLEPQQHEGGAIQAAADGDAIAYIANGPVTAEPAGNRSPEMIQVLSRRGAGGWETQDIDTPNDAARTLAIGVGPEYRVFSTDLSLGLLEPHDDTPLSSEATERTPYLREDASGRYLPLVTAANVAPGVKFGGPLSNEFSEAEAVAASPDLSHVILTSKIQLTTTPAPHGGLYEWSNGQLQLVSVLPDNEADELGHELGGPRHAVSDDGSRVVWATSNGELFMRDTARRETVQLNAVQGGSGSGFIGSTFQLANSDGSLVLFTDEQHLTADASPSGSDLYECEIVEVAGKLTCQLSDLSVPEDPSEASDVRGVVLGASEDGSYVYFAAAGVLAPGGEPGGYNLYLYHAGMTRFIAALSSTDERWIDLSQFQKLIDLSVRVSPNGRYLAFMSERSLTGYDNRDAGSGIPDEEVYLYDAQGQGGRGQLVCASCNPTGARPEGMLDSPIYPGPLVDRAQVWKGRWLAASVPGWTSVGLTKALIQSRYLSDSGRLFFDSADALVPQDTNGVEDAYEYEPAGVGSCTTSSQTFDERAAGCVGLVSSGSSGEESVFMEASESGEDVFLLTSAPLATQDLDTAYDMYDAHVCSAAAPCAASVVAPPSCTTADSCRTAPAPQPGVFGAPASATFAGIGNLVPAVAAAPAKPEAKHKARSKRRTRARHKSRSKRKAQVKHRARATVETPAAPRTRGIGRTHEAGTSRADLAKAKRRGDR
jgi:WD40-like Beta Propeller Repeat